MARSKTAQSGSVYQAYLILRVGFVLLPILAGLDKFADVLLGFQIFADWDQYLAPVFPRTLAIEAHTILLGGVEILLGVLVAVKPRIGAYLVVAWLGGIVINLLLLGAYYDIALRDFTLALAALGLGRLSQEFA